MKRHLTWFVAGSLVLCLCALLTCLHSERLKLVALRQTMSAPAVAGQQDIPGVRNMIDTLKAKQASVSNEVARLAAERKNLAEGLSMAAFSELAKEELRTSPEYAPLLASRMQRRIARRYAPVLKALALPPEKSARLAQLLVERDLALADATGLAAGDAPETRLAAQQDAATVANDEIRTLLGNEAYEHFEDECTLAEYRSTVLDEFQNLLAERGVRALTEQQSEELAQLNLSLLRMQLPAPDEDSLAFMQRTAYALRQRLVAILHSDQLALYSEQIQTTARQKRLRAEIAATVMEETRNRP